MKNILIILGVCLNIFCCSAQNYAYSKFSKGLLKRCNYVFLNFKDADSLKSRTVHWIDASHVYYRDISRRGEDCNINEGKYDYNIINGTKSLKDQNKLNKKHDLLFFSTVIKSIAPPEEYEKRHEIIIYRNKKQMKINLKIFHLQAHRGIGYYIQSIPFKEGDFNINLPLYADIEKVKLKKNWFYEGVKYSFFESKQEIIDFTKLKLVCIPFSEKSKQFNWQIFNKK